MTPTEADTLAKRIINCWRGGPPLTEWIEELTPLDAGRAGTTYARLKRTAEHAPTFARWHAEYRSLNTHDASNRPEPCARCDDTGWIEAPDLELIDVTYTQVQPCNCHEGQQRARSDVWTHRRTA